MCNVQGDGIDLSLLTAALSPQESVRDNEAQQEQIADRAMLLVSASCPCRAAHCAYPDPCDCVRPSVLCLGCRD